MLPTSRYSVKCFCLHLEQTYADQCVRLLAGLLQQQRQLLQQVSGRRVEWATKANLQHLDGTNQHVDFD